MTRFLLTLAFLTMVVAAPDRIAAQDELHPAAVADLVLTAHEQTVRIRLTAFIDDRPWRSHWQAVYGEHLDSLFRQLDSDQDGQLSAGEARRLPRPRDLVPTFEKSEVHVAFNFLVLDRDRNQGISFDKLMQYISRFGGESLAVTTAAPTRSGMGGLMTWLDANGDGALSREECSNSAALWQRDRDGDGLLTSGELQLESSGVFGPEFVARPFRAATGKFAFRTEAPAGEPDHEWRVHLSHAAGGDTSSAIEVLAHSAAAREQAVRVSQADASVQLRLGEHWIEFRLVPPVLRRDQELRRTLLGQFASAANAEGIVTSGPSDLAAPLQGVYELADANSDGQLESTELQRYLDLVVAAQMAVESARLRLTVYPERNTLAQLADANLDGRLGARELQALSTLLFPPESADTPDAPVPGRKLPRIVSLALQRGPFVTREASAAMPDGGPVWFFRADRNRDGDLDSTEFLGDAALFAAWDTNRDGWLDVWEAIRADRQMPSTSTPKEHP